MNKLLIKNIVLGSLLAVHSLSAESNSEEDSNLEKEVVGISGKSNQIDLVIKTEESSLPNKETNEDTQASRVIAVEECVQSLINFNYLIGTHPYVNSYNENGRGLVLGILEEAQENIKQLEASIKTPCEEQMPETEGFWLSLRLCQADVLKIMKWLHEGYAGDRYRKLRDSITHYNTKLMELGALLDPKISSDTLSAFNKEWLCYYINCKSPESFLGAYQALGFTAVVSLFVGYAAHSCLHAK